MSPLLRFLRPLLVVALGAAAATAAVPPADPAPALSLSAATGAVAITNSAAGGSVLQATGLRPGTPVGGSVRIGNAGSANAAIALDLVDLADTPGPGGGRLGDALRLRVADAARPGQPPLYEGTLNDLAGARIGTVAPGQGRDLVLTAWLEDVGNAYQQAGASFGLRWTASETTAPADPDPPTLAAPVAPVPLQTPVPEAVPPTPAPTPPAPPATGGGPPGPAPATAPTTVDPTALGFPGARRCLSRRRFTIRLRHPLGMRIATAAVTVNGRRARVRRGKRPTATIDLRGMTRRKVVVRIAIRTAEGRRVTATRTYRTCAQRRAKKR